GSAVIQNRANLTVQNSLFSGNFANNYEGAGIWNRISGILTVTNTTFQNNQAGAGAAIYNDNGAISVANSAFTSNIAYEGGAIATLGGNVEINGSSFDGNSATYEGGALYGAGQTALITLTQTSLTNNSAVQHGGAVANVKAAPIYAEAITVTNNS